MREAQIYSAIQGSDETRIDMIEVPAGGYIPPHRHSSRTEFITILSSAGAQLQIGDRIFRPIAGQVFQREPGDILALTNDSQHPFCYSVVRFRYESSDVEYLNAPDEDEPEAVAVLEPSEEVEVVAQEPVAETETDAEEEPAEDEPSTDEPSEDEEEDSDEESPDEEAAEEEVAAEPEPEPKPEPKKSKKSGKKSKDGKDSKSSKKKSSKSSKKKK